MNYNDLSTQQFDNLNTTYPSFLGIRDDNATTADLERFLDIGKKDGMVSEVILSSSKVTKLPKGLFQYFPNLRRLNIWNCGALEKIEEIPINVENFELSITNCPFLKELPTAIFQSDKLKSLRLEVLPLIDFPTKTKSNKSLLNFLIKKPQKTTYEDWNLPALKSLTLKQLSIKSLPIINTPELYSLSIQADTFTYFDVQQIPLKRLSNLKINSPSFTGFETLKQLRGLSSTEIIGNKTAIDLTTVLENIHGYSLTFNNCNSFTASQNTTVRGIRSIQFKDCDIAELPAILGNCQLLESLHIQDCPITTVPKEIVNAKRLNRVSFYHCKMETIPEILFQLPLTSLSLSHNKNPIQSFPKDWSDCDKLVRLYLTDNKMEIPDLHFLNDLPALTSLSINGNSLLDKHSLIRKKKLPLDKPSYSILKGCRYHKRAEIISAFRGIANAPLSEKDQHFFFDTIWKCKVIRDFPTPPDDILMKGLCISWSPLNTYFKELFLTRIEKHNQQPLEISENTIFSIIGKIGMKKTALKTKVEEFGGTYSTKLSPKVTHVIIGNNPTQFDLLEHKSLHICTEQQFQNYISKQNPSFLQQEDGTEDSQMLDNLYLLLKNPDPANFEIAMEILKNGGVPTSMIEDLVILQKTHESSKVRSQIKKLLKLYGPEDWHPILDDRHAFVKLAQGEQQEWVVTKKLKKIGIRTAPEYAVRLSILLFKKFGKGLRYALLQQGKVADELYENIINDLVQNDVLNWSKAIGMRQNEKLNYAGEYSSNYYTKSVKIPVQLLKNTLILGINFYDCGMEKIPKEVFAFPKLSQLNLAKNNLKELPDSLQSISELEDLDISFNHLETFPKIVFKLKKLKKLNLKGNKFKENLTDYLSDLKEQLPDCEVVV